MPLGIPSAVVGAAADGAETASQQSWSDHIAYQREYCMRYPVDARRPNAVASRGEQAAFVGPQTQKRRVPAPRTMRPYDYERNRVSVGIEYAR
ncbi:MAG: hypothetical protein EHM89_02760 [Acidobacteria bacterium]|nr:MAG: hypothetical protein EHM89_02760 [Acidobacteriota bacterium]